MPQQTVVQKDLLRQLAFGALAIATVLKVSKAVALILPITILCAVMLLRTKKDARIKGDAAIAMISVGALSAMRLFKSFKAVTICSAVLAVICSLFGILISIAASTPAGATILVIQLCFFGICSVVGIVRCGRI